MSGSYQEYLRLRKIQLAQNRKWRSKQTKESLRTKARLGMRKWRKNSRAKALAASRRSDAMRKLSHGERKKLRYKQDIKYRNAKKRQAKQWIERNHTKWLLRQIKLLAKKTGIKFNLTISDIVVPKRCPVFGIPLRRGVGHSCDNPTVDRVDAKRGYVKGNIAVMSRLANSMKGHATAAQHRRIAEWMESFALDAGPAACNTTLHRRT